MTKKIIDEFTDLPVSRQRKHQLRNPSWNKKRVKKWRKTSKTYREYQKSYGKKWREENPDYMKEYYRKKRLDSNTDI